MNLVAIVLITADSYAAVNGKRPGSLWCSHAGYEGLERELLEHLRFVPGQAADWIFPPELTRDSVTLAGMRVFIDKSLPVDEIIFYAKGEL